MAGFHSILNNPTSLDNVRQIEVRTLIMCGERTTVPDRRVTEILRAHMPKSRYTIIPGADPMSPLSHPEFIPKAIREHKLNALDRNGITGERFAGEEFRGVPGVDYARRNAERRRHA